VKFRRTNRFKKDYQKLPSDVQRRVDQKLRLLLQDPRYPSLRVHKLRGVEGLWEFSVTMEYRVIFEIEGEYYVLLGVGPHSIVDQI
jgi:addiction module RelE/StbE family toxin